MSNEVVKYHNDLNTVVMRRWTSEELNLFFAIIAKARDKGTQELSFSTNELKQLINFKPTSTQRWMDIIKNAINRMASIYYFEENEQTYEVMPLFGKFKYNKINETLDIRLNGDYTYILNNITSKFTIFELQEFINLKSTYAKTMYRLLKQWRTVGKKRFNKEVLYMLLDVPKSTQPTKNFNPRVLTPIQEELSPIFKGLKIEPVRARKQGRPIIAYDFSWKAEKVGKWVKDKYNYKTSAKNHKEIIPQWFNEQKEIINEHPKMLEYETEEEIRKKLKELLGE